jgi:hypothetical protein
MFLIILLVIIPGTKPEETAKDFLLMYQVAEKLEQPRASAITEKTATEAG